MQQKFRGTLGVGTAVYDHRIAALFIGHGRPHGGPANALDALYKQGGPGKQSAGGTGGHKGIPLPLGQHPQTDHHGRVLPLVDHLAGVVVHIHHVLRPGDLHALGQIVAAGLPENFQNFLTFAYQRHLGTKIPVGIQGTQHRRFRGQVAAHGIKNNLHIVPSFLSFLC